MARPSTEKVLHRARDLGLLNERQVREIWASFAQHNVPIDDLLQTMVRREFLTNYQIERLMRGERSGYFYGDYKILYLVGTGTFARVFRAVHRATGQITAVKVLRNRYSDTPAQYEQFVREGRLGLALRHPNIVPIHEVFSEGTMHFLAMDFIEGQNLRDLVKIRGKFNPEDATQLMIDVTNGLGYAFENGLTHRDLKMSNVLVSSRRQAKLVDFGLAALDEGFLRNMDVAEAVNARAVDYAALERATGVRKDDTRSDLYFLGCMFYHMLTAQPPLSETRDRLQRLSKQRFLEVVPLNKLDPSLPAPVVTVVNRAMSLDPTHRYQTPAEMLQDLGNLAEKLAEMPEQAEPVETEATEATEEEPPPEAKPESAKPHHKIMVVESNTALQDVFREGFKRAGYRVLLTGDPARAIERFRQDPYVVDCVIFNAQEIGEPALEAFNQLGNDPDIDFIPAMLLLDEKQHEWEEKAETGAHRIVLPMPITMKMLRVNLAKLIAMEVAREQK